MHPETTDKFLSTSKIHFFLFTHQSSDPENKSFLSGSKNASYVLNISVQSDVNGSIFHALGMLCEYFT